MELESNGARKKELKGLWKLLSLGIRMEEVNGYLYEELLIMKLLMGVVGLWEC